MINMLKTKAEWMLKKDDDGTVDQYDASQKSKYGG